MNVPKVKSLYKALGLLDYFTVPPYEMGVSELAKELDIPKSSVHNMLSTFAAYGLLEYNERTKLYRLGYKAVEFSNTFQKSDSFISIMRPYLERVSRLCNECVYLGRLVENSVLYLDVIYPNNTTGGGIVGIRAPLYCTGIGKAMLAKADPSVRDKVLSSPMEGFTEDTITQPEVLLAQLAEINRCGYAVDNMEHEVGIKCVAVPICDFNGCLVGAVSVSGPSLRFSDSKIQEHARVLLDVAHDVSRCL